MKLPLASLLFILFTPLAISAETAPAPVKRELLDPMAFQQEVDGKLTVFTEAEAKGGPMAVVWTDKSQPELPDLNNSYRSLPHCSARLSRENSDLFDCRPFANGHRELGTATKAD